MKIKPHKGSDPLCGSKYAVSYDATEKKLHRDGEISTMRRRKKSAAETDLIMRFNNPLCYRLTSTAMCSRCETRCVTYVETLKVSIYH